MSDQCVSVLSQDTGCNTASLHDFLVTLSCLEGKEFQVVPWIAGGKTTCLEQNVSSCMLDQVCIKLSGQYPHSLRPHHG